MARNLRLTLAYDGTDFSGWQVQPGRATVQGELSAALERVTGEKVLPQGSGRTDAGVHALAQVASCALESPIPPANLLTALNDVLPPSIRVTSIAEAPPDFHARHCARSKIYHYRIWRGAICPPSLARFVCHHPYPLDQAAMQQAAEVVIGQHDFTSFAAVDPEKSREERGSNARHITSSRFERLGEELVYQVEGEGFLHHMVRNLVGTFLLVGKGTLTAPDVRRILAARDRSSAGPTAPAGGLWLVEVRY